MRRQFPIFTLFSVALYILIMSIHIAAKQGEIADKILANDSQSVKFKKKLIQLAISKIGYLKNE